MSKGVQAALELVGAAVAAYFGQYQLAAALAGAAYSTERANKAEVKAKNAYNASLRDRYAMVRSTTTARQLVFGRCRVSGPMFYAASYGDKNVHLSICIALAAHEVDGIEDVYFDDQPVVLDSSGNVLSVRQQDSFSILAASATVTVTKTPAAGTVSATVRYGDQVVPLTITAVSGVHVTVSGATAGKVGQLDVYYQPTPDPYAPSGVTQRSSTFLVTSATQTFTLPSTGSAPAPDASGVHAVYQVSSPTADDATAISGAVVAGYNVTLSGLTVGRKVVIYYQTLNGLSKARVRKHLGGPGQTADAGMLVNFPGTWTTMHRALGVAYLVVEMDYDPNAFSGGIPNVSAVVRGMKCYDPRTGTTAWTENPALHARALATFPIAGDLPAAAIDDASFIAAANVCDTSATYTVGGMDHARALYTASYPFSVDRPPVDGLGDLCQAMGGDWVFSDGQLRVKAGAYRTPNPGVLDENWLSDDESVQVQVGAARASLINTITGSFSDQYQDYVPIPLPQVPPARDASGAAIANPYADADGATLVKKVQYAAVPFSGQAQYLSACYLRRQRQGLVVRLKCNWRAWQDQAFDVRSVSLARFGWVNKPFEVIKDGWTPDGSIELVLQETAPEIWDMDEGFSATDLAPNTNMPVPWGLPAVTNLTATTGDATLLRLADGTVLPQVMVSWDAITDDRVLEGGYVEFRYWRLGDLSDTYQTFRAQGADAQAFLAGVRSGSMYLVTARTVSAVTQGPWCTQVLTNAAGKSLGAQSVTGMAYALGGGRVHLSWDACTDLDYKLTEIRVGASWAAGTKIAALAATAFDWPQTTAGSYTLWFANQNFSGGYGTPASLAVTVDTSVTANSNKGINSQLANVSGGAVTTPHTVAAYGGVQFNSDGRIWKKSGGVSAPYVATSQVWWLGAPTIAPTSGYTLNVNFVSANLTSGSGTYSAKGSFSVALGAGNLNVLANVTGCGWDLTYAYSITDANGNTMAAGNIFLSVESSD